MFQSVGAFVQADRLQHTFEMKGNIGDLLLQANHSRFEDNLDNVPSILKALARNHSFSTSLPLVSVFGNREKPSPFCPVISYNWNRTHQFGDGIPPNSDFKGTLYNK